MIKGKGKSEEETHEYHRIIKNMLDEKNLHCNNNWNMRKIGEGEFGVVNELCCDDECKYILKSMNVSEQNFNDEVKYQDISSTVKIDLFKLQNNIKMMNKQLSPLNIEISNNIELTGSVAVINSYYNKMYNRGHLIMEKMDMTVKDFIKNQYKIYFESTENIEIIKTNINNIVNVLSSLTKFLISKLYSIGIIHDDTHSENIMINIKKTDNTMLITKLTLIDFGLVKLIDNRNDKELISKLSEIDLTYNMFRIKDNNSNVKNLYNEIMKYEKKQDKYYVEINPEQKVERLPSYLPSTPYIQKESKQYEDTPIRSLSFDNSPPSTPVKVKPIMSDTSPSTPVRIRPLMFDNSPSPQRTIQRAPPQAPTKRKK